MQERISIGAFAALTGLFGEGASALPGACTIPGVATVAAEVIIAEIGVDMERFPTAGHLASWACAPGTTSTARNGL